MALDKKEFIDNYLNETGENLQTLGEITIHLRKHPDDGDKLAEFLRLLHSIKGTSRMMEYGTVESIAHGLEDIFKGVRDRKYSLGKIHIQLVLSSISYMERALDQIKATGNGDISIKALQAVLEQAVAGLPINLDLLDGDKPAEREIVQKDRQEKKAVKENREYDTVRIKISMVDEIIRKLNSLIIQQFQFKRENESIQKLDETLRKIRTDVSHLSDTDPRLKSLAEEIGESQKLVHKISKNYSEEMVQLEHSSFELQEQILGLRMLPMGLVLNPLKKMVEETTLAMGKEIEFETTGTDLLLDKTILEQINDPIIHIVRNAIDHGIESMEERAAAGKPPQGSVAIRCTSESGRLNLKIIDDGRGLDFKKIRAKALSLYPDQEEEIKEMADNQLTSFLFRSGFSTKQKITSLSGRGVGLDIVQTNIENVKGKIIMSSEFGKGTTITLSLPLSLATVDGFFVSSQEERFLIPAAFVREILIIEKTDIMAILNRNVIRVRDQIIPVYPLAALLDKDVSVPREKLSIVVVESLGDIIGVIVDSVIQFASLIYKPLPNNLIKLKVIQGVVFDENFDIINILYIPDLINRFKGIRSIEFRKRFSSQEKEYKQILVVDDSLSTREIEKSILELDGYNVVQAVDGIDALEKMRDQYFHLILTDVQMPRMDGYTLIENIRRQEKFAETPIIVVSSESEGDSRRRLEKSGADTIFSKKDFNRGSLLQKVRELIG